MLDTFLYLISATEEFLWSYVGITLILGIGGYFTLSSGFFQLRQMPLVFKNFFQLMRSPANGDGVHPIKAFFAAVGGCVGLGNLVGTCYAVKIGGPGAVFWMWIAGFVGMTLKYAEIYLGMKTRVGAGENGHQGGPMYFLPKAFGSWAATVVCFFLCLYGVEIYMFRVMTDSIVTNWEVNRVAVVAVLFVLVFFAGSGGIRRVADISSVIIPFFLLGFGLMSLYIMGLHFREVPGLLLQVIDGAFTGQAASGAFVGSSIQLAMARGMAAGAYTGDLGIGYASVIHSESSETNPQRQAALGIFGIVLDTFVVCSLSVFLILVTGVWDQGLEASDMVQAALSNYFPYMHIFMPIFLFLLGYSTMIAYFVVGAKSAKFLWPKYGTMLFYLYGAVALFVFSFVPQDQAYSVMLIVGGLLVVLNVLGIFVLRKEIDFDLSNGIHD